MNYLGFPFFNKSHLSQFDLNSQNYWDPNPAKETTDNLFIPLILPDTAIRREL